MPTTCYVVAADPAERSWISDALCDAVDVISFVDRPPVLQELADPSAGSWLLAFADADPTAILQLVRELRAGGSMLPVIVVGPHTAFRAAVDIARLAATDFLERPVSARQLRAAALRSLGEPD